jgi:hypothetical protein
VGTGVGRERWRTGLVVHRGGGGTLNERSIAAEHAITDVDVDAGHAGAHAGHIGAAGTAPARVDDSSYVAP